jgi:hypothetical protein
MHALHAYVHPTDLLFDSSIVLSTGNKIEITSTLVRTSDSLLYIGITTHTPHRNDRLSRHHYCPDYITASNPILVTIPHKTNMFCITFLSIWFVNFADQDQPFSIRLSITYVMDDDLQNAD